MPAAVSVSMQFDPSTDPTIVDTVADLVSSACGLNTSAVGIFHQTAPFASNSSKARRLVSQQARHPLSSGSSARITGTRYTDGVTDIVVVLGRQPALELPQLLDKLEGLDAHLADSQFDDADNEAAIDLDTSFDDRIESVATASAIALSRYLDTQTIAMSVASSVQATPAHVVCDTSPTSSVSRISSDIEAAIDLLARQAISPATGQPDTKSIAVVDHRDARGVFHQRSNDAVDVQISVRNGRRQGTARLVAHTESVSVAEFLQHAMDGINVLYPQIYKARPESLVRDLQLGIPSAAVTAARDHQHRSMRLEQYVTAHAASRPDSIAVVDEVSSLTFKELDEAADDIAANLRRLSVRDGDFVAVATSRSADMYAVILAIWKCGAAYVPIDVDFPLDRITRILAESGARLAVVEPRLADSLRSAAAVIADLKRPSAIPFSAASPPQQSIDAPAYAIFTSGTTGVPKGAVVTHASVVALIAGLRDELSLSEDDVWTNFHSPAFDFSVWEMWGAMVTGGTAVVVTKDTARDPHRFHEYLCEHQVTILSQTPSAFAHLTTADTSRTRLNALRLVVLGGEPLNPTVAATWLDRYPRQTCRLVNMYGITETTVHVTTQDVDKHVALRTPKSVGHPIPGWRYHVVGFDLRPARTGFPGEIYIAGAGLALFYLGNPGLTAQRFIAGSDGQRWYRTGDLGRLRDDGSLEHLGRIDSQIKINGYRIELDEIKNTILRQPNIRDAVVVCNFADGRFHVPRLDAYVVGASIDIPALRNAVFRFLPDYMRPATFTEVEEIPLTINGKVDLSKLPAPTVAEQRASDIGDGPNVESSEQAERIKQAWSDVLGVEPSADANFFLHGGNSLAAIHLRTELAKLGIELPLNILYSNPTYGGLTAALRG